jgi:hypothetical protein
MLRGWLCARGFRAPYVVAVEWLGEVWAKWARKTEVRPRMKASERGGNFYVDVFRHHRGRGR